MSMSCILIPLFIFWKFDSLKWLIYRKQKLKRFADFYATSAEENGVLPSKVDKALDSWNNGDTFYFFGFEGEDLFQLTLKIRKTGGFFILKIKLKDFAFENCGHVEKEYDGFRGRYLQVSKLEDGRRWRIVVLCNLAGDRQEIKFAKINLFFQALQAPVGGNNKLDDWKNWSQFGVLHGLVRNGAEEEDLYLRGVRGKQRNGVISSMVFTGDYGKMVMLRGEEGKLNQGSLFLPGENISNIYNVKPKDRCSYSFTDNDNSNHFLITDENSAQCDNEKGQLKVLLLPTLNMAPEEEIFHINQSGIPLTLVSFSDPNCDNSNLTGGKGSSLGRLSKMEELSVPAGFCLTTTFWEQMIDENLRRALADLEKATCCPLFSKTKLEIACNSVKEAISNVVISYQLVKEIEELGNLVFSRNTWGNKLAVRSSAIGEDGKELSCAGQNDTFLGVLGKDNVISSIAKCWASLYSYRSVEYRRQHGQPILASMSVVLQEMVDPVAAGVIFTADPLTGEEGKITITANWGLGESVVGGNAEPDTIIVMMTDGKYAVSQKDIGSKKLRYKMSDDGNMEEIRSVEEDGTCCLTDDQAYRLAKLATGLDQQMNCALDIEFALTDSGDIKILQARPVTTFFSWTDWELEHEFDTAKPSKKDISTRGNLGEVFPGAATPLTTSSVIKTLDLAIAQGSVPKSDERSYVSHTNTWVSVISQQAFLNVLDGIHKYPEETLSLGSKGLDYSVFGHPVTTQEMLDSALMRHAPRGHIKQNLILIWDLINRKNIHKITVETFKTLQLFPHLENNEDISSQSLYNDISNKFHFLLKVGIGHTFNSEKSSVIQVIILLVLAGDQETWTAELLADVANLLTLDKSGSVESAGVPAGLEKLAQKIRLTEGWEVEFANEDVEKAERWLREELSESLKDFDEKFGHRCLKEFDLISDTWGSKLAPVIQTLQSTLKCNFSQKPSSKDQTILEKLPFGKKVALGFLLPLSYSCVSNREESKSLLIRTIGQFRNAYRKLGQILAETGALPDKELIYFLTHHELQQLIFDDHKSLIMKSIRRRNLYKKWDNIVFPEMVFGYPTSQSKNNDLPNLGGHNRVTGTPACPGRVTGTARVVLHISEASSIQAGEILITHSTDIGWSPYFPILGGVVTELGGLISHGAVVAREYGLPCLVGVTGATQIFSSGDLVCLDCNKGVLVKVESD